MSNGDAGAAVLALLVGCLAIHMDSGRPQNEPPATPRATSSSSGGTDPAPARTNGKVIKDLQGRQTFRIFVDAKGIVSAKTPYGPATIFNAETGLRRGPKTDIDDKGPYFFYNEKAGCATLAIEGDGNGRFRFVAVERQPVWALNSSDVHKTGRAVITRCRPAINRLLLEKPSAQSLTSTAHPAAIPAQNPSTLGLGI